jgi:DnaJ like chaperone protein
MAANEKSTRSIFSDVRDTLGGLFGGKLDAKHEALVHCMFSLLGAMARADGVVSTEEATFTNTLMDELKLSTRARQVATGAFAIGCKREFDLDKEILVLLSQYRRGSAEVIKVYEALLRLAAADAMIRPGERRFLEKITLGLGFEPTELDERLKRIMH